MMNFDLLTHHARSWNADFWTFEDPTRFIVGFEFRHRDSNKTAKVYMTAADDGKKGLIVKMHVTTGHWYKHTEGSNITSFEHVTDTQPDPENDDVVDVSTLSNPFI